MAGNTAAMKRSKGVQAWWKGSGELLWRWRMQTAVVGNGWTDGRRVGGCDGNGMRKVIVTKSS